MSVDYRLALDYQLQSGWLEPFVNGLLNGVAVARQCSACQKTTYPPVRVCECRSVDGKWINLSGEARIEHRCNGSEGNFALVQFEGATTQTVVRLNGMTDVDEVGYLQSSRVDNPATKLSETPAQLPELVLAPHKP